MEQPFPFASDSHGLRPSFVNQTLTLPAEMLIGLCRHAAPPKLVPQRLPPSTRHNPEIGIMTQLVLSYERETFLDDNPARIDGGYGRQVHHVELSLTFSAAVGSGYHMLQPLGTDSSAGQRVRAVFDPVDPSCLLRSRA